MFDALWAEAAIPAETRSSAALFLAFDVASAHDVARRLASSHRLSPIDAPPSAAGVSFIAIPLGSPPGSRAQNQHRPAVQAWCCGTAHTNPALIAALLLQAPRAKVPEAPTAHGTTPINDYTISFLSTLSVVLVVDGRMPWSLLRQLRALAAFAAAVISEACKLAASDGAGRLLTLLQARVRAALQRAYANAAAASNAAAAHPSPPSATPALDRLRAAEAAASSAPPLRAGELSSNLGAPVLVAVTGLAALGPGERAGGGGRAGSLMGGGGGVDSAAILQQVATRTAFMQGGGGVAGGGVSAADTAAGDAGSTAGGAGAGSSSDAAAAASGSRVSGLPSASAAAQAAAVDALGLRRAAALAAALRAEAAFERGTGPLDDATARFALAALRRESLRLGATVAVLPGAEQLDERGPVAVTAPGSAGSAVHPWRRFLGALAWACDAEAGEGASAAPPAGGRAGGAREAAAASAAAAPEELPSHRVADESSPLRLFIPSGSDSAGLIADGLLLAARWGVPPPPPPPPPAAPASSSDEDADADARLAIALSEAEFARAVPEPLASLLAPPGEDTSGDGNRPEGGSGSLHSDISAPVDRAAGGAWWASEAAMLQEHVSGGPLAGAGAAGAAESGQAIGAWLLLLAERHRDTAAGGGGVAPVTWAQPQAPPLQAAAAASALQSASQQQRPPPVALPPAPAARRGSHSSAAAAATAAATAGGAVAAAASGSAEQTPRGGGTGGANAAEFFQSMLKAKPPVAKKAAAASTRKPE